MRAINAHKMDQAIIFCRTKLDCDHIEEYLVSLGGGEPESCQVGVVSGGNHGACIYRCKVYGERVLLRLSPWRQEATGAQGKPPGIQGSVVLVVLVKRKNEI